MGVHHVTPKLVAAVLVACLALAAPAAALDSGSQRVSAQNALERSLLGEINAYRAQHGLRALRLNRRLAAAAGAHSTAMIGAGFFAHESRDGTPFWQRVARWYAKRGYRSWGVGENLLWASPDVSAGSALKMWVASPPHRRNLLNPRWREVGLGALHASAAPGTFDGRAVTVLTADFGARR